MSATQAFEQFFEENERMLFNRLYRQLPSVEDVSDIVQETFTRVWSHWPIAPEYATFWLFRVASNCVRDFYRRKRRVVTTQIEDSDSRSEDEYASVVEEVLSQLTAQQATVIRMRVLADKSFREIAEQFDIREQTARRCYFRACADARRFLLDDSRDQRSTVVDRDVLKLVAYGKTYRQIAPIVGSSVSAVQSAVRRVEATGVVHRVRDQSFV